MEPESGWQFVDAVHFGATVLNGQPKGQELKFRVITFNKAGDGTLSNTYQGWNFIHCYQCPFHIGLDSNK